MTAPRPLEADIVRRAVSDVLTATNWNRVFQAINAITSHQPESDEEFDRADSTAIAAALSTARWYQAKAPALVPDAVFMLPDGGLMFEWRDRDGTILRADFAPGGKCQFMVTYADDRDAEFIDFVPPQDTRSRPVASRSTSEGAVDLVWSASKLVARKAKYERRWPEYRLAS